MTDDWNDDGDKGTFGLEGGGGLSKVQGTGRSSLAVGREEE